MATSLKVLWNKQRHDIASTLYSEQHLSRKASNYVNRPPYDFERTRFPYVPNSSLQEGTLAYKHLCSESVGQQENQVPKPNILSHWGIITHNF